MSHEPAEWDRQETLIARFRREAAVRDEELATLRVRLDAAEHSLPAEAERLSGDFYLVAEGP